MICLFTNASMTGTASLYVATRGFLVLARDRRRDAANRRTHPGAQCYVAHAMLLGLAGSFFGGLGIGHEISVSSRPPVAGGGSLLIGHRRCQRRAYRGGAAGRLRFGPGDSGAAASHKLASMNFGGLGGPEDPMGRAKPVYFTFCQSVA